MKKLVGKVALVTEAAGESAWRSQSGLRTWSRSDDPTSPIPTRSSGSQNGPPLAEVRRKTV